MNRIEKLQEFLTANAEDSFLQHALALEYIKTGAEDKAQELFEAILQREPGYTGTYYHLAKLLERTGKSEEAIPIYKKGMEECKKINDQHAYNELQAALEDITDV
jgi:Tfp pilus assembly protein PilF